MELKGKKLEKAKVVEDLHSKFEKAEAVILTDFIGLDVAQINEIRSKLKKRGAEYRVIKNTLAKRAAQETEVHLIEDYFTGPTGVVIGFENIVPPIKTLSEYVSKYEPFKIRIGVLEGTVFESDRIREIANLPSRDILIGKAVGSIKSPLYGFAATMQAMLTRLVLVLKSVSEKKGEGL